MTPQQIKEQAPVNATHYYQYKNGNVIYFKHFSDSGHLYRITPNWGGTDYTVDRLTEL